MDSNHRLQESKSCALPLGDSPIEKMKRLFLKKAFHSSTGWIKGFEPLASRATIWRANQLRYTHHNSVLFFNFDNKFHRRICLQMKNVPEGIRTPDTWLRRPLLYPTELLAHIVTVQNSLNNFLRSSRVFHLRARYRHMATYQAGDGNRTHVSSLEG